MPQRPLVLVTGSSGRIAARICAALRAEYDVIGLDRDPPEEDWGCAWLQVDLADPRSIASALAGLRRLGRTHVASVVHLAPRHDSWDEPGAPDHASLVAGTGHLLRGLRVFEHVEQLVCSSTSPVSKAGRQPEASPEGVLRAERGDIPFVTLRIPGVYDEHTHSIALAQQMRSIYELRLRSHFAHGGKLHGRSFVHLDDLAHCVRAVVDRRAALASEETFLVGEVDVMSHAELLDALGHEIHGRAWTTIRIPAPIARAGAWLKERLPGQAPAPEPWTIDVARTLSASIRHASEVLHWQPQNRLRESLPEMARRLVDDPIAWYRENGIEPPSRLVRRGPIGNQR